MNTRFGFAWLLLLAACGADATFQDGEPAANSVEGVEIEARRLTYECIDGCPGTGFYGTDTLAINIEAIDDVSSRIEWLGSALPGHELGASSKGPIASTGVVLASGQSETVYLTRSYDTTSCSSENREYEMNVLIRVDGELIELPTTAVQSMGWDC